MGVGEVGFDLPQGMVVEDDPIEAIRKRIHTTPAERVGISMGEVFVLLAAVDALEYQAKELQRENMQLKQDWTKMSQMVLMLRRAHHKQEEERRD